MSDINSLPRLVSLSSHLKVLCRRFGQVWQKSGPQVVASFLAFACGLLQIGSQIQPILESLRGLTVAGAALRLGDLAVFPPFLVGFGLFLMAFGLLLSARLAWVIGLLLGLLSAGLAVWKAHRPDAVFATAALLLLDLVVYARRFDRSSLAAGSLFALLGIGSLLIYGTLGCLWFGAGYAPPIRTLSDAFYYTVVTMSTVGYGDIAPRTPEARLFTVSMILLGISVFATTLSVVVAPLVGGSLKRILEGRMQKRQRRDHFVILGASSLASTVWKELKGRGAPVTVIIAPGQKSPYPEDADVIVGDALLGEVLELAGVPQARAVLTLRDDDAENAFAVLAVKEIAPNVKTVAGVNDAQHMAKIRRVQPDLLFAPQILGSELLARTLFDEPIDNDTVTKLLFPKS